VIFLQYYLDCLSHASYLVGDEFSGRAVVVDPQRDISSYLADAADTGLAIERIIETHFHADFLSGHLELAAATGASICYGPGAVAEFPIEQLADGQVLDLGQVRLEVLATPGHTPESISLVVYAHGGGDVPYGVLTGDTLFIGDVGRPDLMASAGVTADALARQLYRSLHTRLLALPDDTRVFPAHGAGSACGRNLSTETSSTMGEQRRTNYALAEMTEEEFVGVVTEGQPTAPLYFPYSASRNRQARRLLDEAASPGLAIDEVLARQAEGAVVLDTREPAEYAAGHLARSLNVGLGGRFAEYAGDVLRPEDSVLLVAEEGHEQEAKVRLARIGFDNVVGHLEAPVLVFVDHPELAVQSSRLTAVELRARLGKSEDILVLDVRSPGEVAEGSIPGALNLALPRLVSRVDDVDRGRPVVTFCASGYRSSIAASLLSAAGHPDVSDLLGGYEAWRVLAPQG
jgi:hydroxyacylglutathione hydrolase